MRVAVIGPCTLPFIRGNSLSLHRLASGLRQRGVESREFCTSDYKNKGDIYRDVFSFRPDIIHGFHAYKTGSVVQYLKKRMNTPLVISLRGTDFNHDLFHKKRRAVVINTLSVSDAIIVFASFARDMIEAENPELKKDKIYIIPHAVRLEKEVYPLLEEMNLKRDHFIFFLPASIRQVKNNLFCLKPLSSLKQDYPKIKLICAGSIIEKGYGSRFIEKIRGLDWAFYLGAIPHERMYSLYKASHVVMNTSLSEGMPNALLEAMSLEKAVLASRIKGNEAIVKEGVDGLLFETEKEFRQKAERLIREKDLRTKLGKRAKQRIRLHHTPKKELDEHIRIYKRLLSSPDP